MVDNMGYPAGRPKMHRAHDPLFNLLARAYAYAFRQAESPDPIVARDARLELCAFFSRDNLNRLHRQGFISWKPEEVNHA